MIQEHLEGDELKIWLHDRIHWAIVRADDIYVSQWMKNFHSDLKAERHRPQEVFNRHLEHFVTKRRQNQYNDLYTDFFEVEGGFSETMLKKLSNRVYAMFMNLEKDLAEAEYIVAEAYAYNFMIDQLNRWKEKSDIDDSTFIQTEETDTPYLTHAQIALLYYLNDWPITQNNALSIAKKYGQSSDKRLMMQVKTCAGIFGRTETRDAVKNYEAIEKSILPEKRELYKKELERAKYHKNR